MTDESAWQVRLIHIESIVAHLQHDLEQINSAVLQQQASLDELNTRLDRIERRIDEQETGDSPLPFDRPPHY